MDKIPRSEFDAALDTIDKVIVILEDLGQHSAASVIEAAYDELDSQTKVVVR